MSSLSGNGALKLLLLLTSLSHYYSGLVTGTDPAKDICASIAANKPVDFFLVGRNSSRRLLITAKPDYLVYDLLGGSLLEDTLNISGVVPVPLSVYFPELFTNEHFKSLDAQSGKVFTFTTGCSSNNYTYIKMISVDHKLLVTFNMNNKSEVLVSRDFIAPDAQQEFVSATDNVLYDDYFYSFYNVFSEKSIRKTYNFDTDPDMNYTSSYYTCNGDKENLILRLNICRTPYKDWDWVSSSKGWSEMLPEMYLNRSVRFYLFEPKNQMVSIFNQDQNIDEDGGDVISVVRQKTYKDFFVCPAPKVTTSIPSTTSAQPNTTSNVTEVANRTTVTSTTLMHNASTKASPDSVQTSTEKPKFAVWIIILIVVLLLVIIITVLALAWYYYGGKKTSDSKPDKVASKGTMPKVRSTVSGGKQSSVVTSKVLSTKVITSKVASSAKVQSSKQSVGAGMPRDAAKVKATSSAGQTKVGTKLTGPKVSASKQLVAGQSQAGVADKAGGKAGGISPAGSKVKATSSAGKTKVGTKLVGPKVNASKQLAVAQSNAGVGSKVGGKTSGISPAGTKLKAKSSAASKASIRSSMVAPSKGPEAKVQGLKAKK